MKWKTDDEWRDLLSSATTDEERELIYLRASQEDHDRYLGTGSWAKEFPDRAARIYKGHR